VRAFKLKDLRKGVGEEMIYRNHLKNWQSDDLVLKYRAERQIQRYIRNPKPGKRSRRACALKFGCEIGVLRGLVEGLGAEVGECLSTLGKTWTVTTNQNWKMYNLHEEDDVRECFHYLNLVARRHRRAAAAARREGEGEGGWWEQ
jgi:hypothetical protein